MIGNFKMTNFILRRIRNDHIPSLEGLNLGPTSGFWLRGRSTSSKIVHEKVSAFFWRGSHQTFITHGLKEFKNHVPN